MNPRRFFVHVRHLRPGSTLLGAATMLLTACDESPTPAPCLSASDAAVCSAADASGESAAGETRGAELDASHDANAEGGVLDASREAQDGHFDALVDAGLDVPTEASSKAPSDAAPTDASDGAPSTAACDPAGDPKDAPCAVDETYGVFVASSGTDDGYGTRTQPLRTIAEGIALALRSRRPRVFVCQGRYAESVVLGGTHGDVSLYGGLDCIGGWTWTGGPVQVTAQGPLSALRVQDSTAPIVIEDISFTGPDAAGTDAAGAGRSSIAAWLSGATVTFRRVTLVAGQGADGGAGADAAAAPNYPIDEATAPPGSPYSYSPAALGAGGTNACLRLPGAASQGGVGGSPGDRAAPQGYSGGAGSAVPPPLLSGASLVFDGAGGPALGTPCVVGALDGNVGASGTAGPPGGMAASPGVLTAAGWAPSPGEGGSFGNTGQGGGGGAGEPFYPFGPAFGGGGGGAGGCGGAGGGGGQGGGASFALVSLQSVVSLYASTLIASDGGRGGSGGAGQPGQAGGAGANGGCAGSGGTGGSGAGGSGGGGGSGGLAVGIAYQGPLPVYDTHTTIDFGVPGAEGLGGPPGPHAATASQAGLDGAPGGYGRGGLATAVSAL